MKYRFRVSRFFSTEVEVDAESRAEAALLAEEEVDPLPIYDYDEDEAGRAIDSLLYCVACGQPDVLLLPDCSIPVCADCTALAQKQGRVDEQSGWPIVLFHYCAECGAPLGNQQGISPVEGAYCEQHRSA